MPSPASKTQKTVAKNPRKKSSLFRIILPVILIIIIGAFLFVTTYTPKTKPVPRPKNPASESAAPIFRKDGSLTILRDDREPLTLDIEIADEEDERMQGLMYRYKMDETQGMFFIFPQEDWRSFWMKNTYISLDIMYINNNMEIVSIQKYTQPRSTYSLPSEKPARYVLEVVAGFTDKHGIKPGDKIEF